MIETCYTALPAELARQHASSVWVRVDEGDQPASHLQLCLQLGKLKVVAEREKTGVAAWLHLKAEHLTGQQGYLVPFEQRFFGSSHVQPADVAGLLQVKPYLVS